MVDNLSRVEDGLDPPINRIPFDIFQVIITLCRDDRNESFQYTVSHVCRLWREYVHSMPLLWNRLDINKSPLKWDLLEAKLERSGRAPLDIHIGQQPFAKSALPTLRKIMRMILPHLSRWGCLHLVDVPHKIKRIVLDQVRARHTPLLEEVRVLQSSYYDRPSKLLLQNTCSRWKSRDLFSGHLPCLRTVEWSSPLDDPKALPSFKNLRDLTLGDGTLNDRTALPFISLIHQLLTDSPSLECLRIQHIPSNVVYALSTNDECVRLHLSPLTHKLLRTLIVDSSPTLRSTVLRTLILPNLRTISKIYYNHYVELSVCESIAQWNSLPSLRVLSIAEDSLIGSTANPNLPSQLPFLARALHNLVNLRALTLRSINFEGDKYIPDLGTSCPHLRWLLFVLCRRLSVPAVRAIVERRIRTEGMSPLEVLCIQADHWRNTEDSRLTQEDVEWFSEHVDTFKQQDDLHYVTKDCW
ncbi:hypothetical protein FRB90_012338 [Tulasnella sp. 427]|nr:hypothetical protein FRB90_012338 [Tulasnella sp. 427]